MSNVSYQHAEGPDTDTQSPSLQLPVPALQDDQTPSAIASWLDGLSNTTTGQKHGDPPAHEDRLGTGVSQGMTHNSGFGANPPGHGANNLVPSQSRRAWVHSRLYELQANILKAESSKASGPDRLSALTEYSVFLSELNKDETKQDYEETLGITPEERTRRLDEFNTMASQGIGSTPFQADGNVLIGMSFSAFEDQLAQITADNGGEQCDDPRRVDEEGV
jgi:hypothetical protein